MMERKIKYVMAGEDPIQGSVGLKVAFECEGMSSLYRYVNIEMKSGYTVTLSHKTETNTERNEQTHARTHARMYQPE